MSKELGLPGKPLRGALVGFGNVAIRAHLPIWRDNPDFRIEAVIEPHPDRARLVADYLPEIPVYPGLEALQGKSSIDFVDICTPPGMHAETILGACRGGLHVFCEKPLVTAWEDFERVCLACRASGTVVFSVNNWKYAPLWDRTLTLVREGHLGRIRSVSLEVQRTTSSGGGASDWRGRPEIAGGGILLDHGWHNLYLIAALIGQYPESISVKMGLGTRGAKEVEDEVDLGICYPGAEAKLSLTWRADARKNLGKIQGERGALLINDDHLLLMPHGAASGRFDFAEALSAGSHHLEWMRPVRDAFLREITDRTVRGTNLKEAGFCARIVDLAYRAHGAGLQNAKVPIPI